jgi:hypothetical protein
MKNNNYIKFSLLLTLAVITYSCKSTKSTTQATAATEETTEIVDKEKARIDRFVPVEAVADLRAGMTIDEASAKLGSKPYNLISGQADGHHIVQYKYRLSKFEVPTETVNNNGVEKKANKLFYDQGYQDLYVVFNGNGKLEYLVTTEGAMSEKILRENNLLYVIKKDKEKFANDPDKLYRETNSDVFTPLVPCQDCDKKSGKSEASKPSTTQNPKSAKAETEEEAAETAAAAPAKMTADSYLKLAFAELDKNSENWKVYNRDGLYKTMSNMAQTNYKQKGDATLTEKQLTDAFTANKKKGGLLKSLIGQ